MIKNNKLYCKNRDNYPPFKKGLYLEEYFLDYYTKNNISCKRKYIPVLWTNFQIEQWFIKNQDIRNEMQNSLDEWLKENPSNDGYFIIVQYDDGPKLKLPENTTVYGACSGDIPIPLIYQDINNTLINMPKKCYVNKSILCSFVGSLTSNKLLPNVRSVMFNTLKNKKNFQLINSGGWTPVVKKSNQDMFINIMA